jgi:hypothetical protein
MQLHHLTWMSRTIFCHYRAIPFIRNVIQTISQPGYGLRCSHPIPQRRSDTVCWPIRHTENGWMKLTSEPGCGPSRNFLLGCKDFGRDIMYDIRHTTVRVRAWRRNSRPRIRSTRRGYLRFDPSLRGAGDHGTRRPLEQPTKYGPVEMKPDAPGCHRTPAAVTASVAGSGILYDVAANAI